MIAEFTASRQIAEENSQELKKITTQLMKTTTTDNVNTSRSPSQEPQVQTRPPQHRVANDAEDAHQYTGRLHPSSGRYTSGPSTNCMSITSFINCSYCGSEHQYGKQFCKATNVFCYRCNGAGHFARMCRTHMSENEDNGQFLYDRSRQNWKPRFDSNFISGRVPSGHLDNSPGPRNI